MKDASFHVSFTPFRARYGTAGGVSGDLALGAKLLCSPTEGLETKKVTDLTLNASGMGRFGPPRRVCFRLNTQTFPHNCRQIFNRQSNNSFLCLFKGNKAADWGRLKLLQPGVHVFTNISDKNSENTSAVHRQPAGQTHRLPNGRVFQLTSGRPPAWLAQKGFVHVKH